MTREEIKEFLSSTEAEVVFKKLDGTTRVMRCTLKSNYLPPLKGSNNARSMEVLPVWDLEKESWRSFRIDSVESIKEIKWLSMNEMK